MVEIWKSDGKEIKGSRLARLKEGDIFGEMALFDKQPRSASAYAALEKITTILMWEEDALKDLFQNNPSLGNKVLQNILVKISSRLRAANETIHILLRANQYIGL